MASIDDIKIKFSVDGKQALDQATASLDGIEKSTKSASESLKQFNIRNVAYQVQDLSVQLAGGTSAFVAFGQQIPQLLSGFGVMGAVIGAIAAAGIPLMQAGLKSAGIDMRNLKERTDDLTTAVKSYHDAQTANMPTLAGLAGQYGALTDEAKAFFEVQEQIAKQKTGLELRASLAELKDNYKSFTDESVKASLQQNKFSTTLNLVGAEIQLLSNKFKAWRLDLTAEQANHVANELKNIEAAAPEQAAKKIGALIEYLKSAGDWENKNKKFYEETLGPLEKIQQQLLLNNEVLKASIQHASDLNAEFTVMQNSYQPDINAAKRNFDQISAIRKEGALKLAEFNAQITEKENKDGVSRWKERAAMELRINQDIADKIKDFAKGQSETFKAASLTNEAKLRQVGLEGDILKLQDEGKLSAANAYQLNEDLLRNAYNYAEALKAIAEQRRKNLIDISQQKKLESEAANIKEKSDDLAYQSMAKRQQEFLKGQQEVIKQDARRLSLSNETAVMSDREKKNAEAIFNINEEREKQIRGLQSLNDPILRVTKEKEINGIYDERIESLKRQQKADKDLQENFAAGWKHAYANYVDSSRNAFNQAQVLFDKVTKGLEDSLASFFETGKFGWKNFLQTIIDQLLRSQIQQLIAKTFGGIGSIGSAGGKGGLLGGAIIPGFLASGGSATAGSPYIVGEQGPELFVPNTSGSVVPNNQLASMGSTNVVYNISAVDAGSFKALLAKDPAFLYSVTQLGAKTIPGRG